MLTKARLLRCLFGNIHVGWDMCTHMGRSWDIPNTNCKPGKSKWLTKETRNKCPIEVLQTSTRAWPRDSVSLPKSTHVSTHRYGAFFPLDEYSAWFTTFCLCGNFFFAKAEARTLVTDHWSSGQDPVLSLPWPSPISGWESKLSSKVLQAEAAQDLQHQGWEKAGKKIVVLKMRMRKLQSHQCIYWRAQQDNLSRATETRSGFYKLKTWLSPMGPWSNSPMVLEWVEPSLLSEWQTSISYKALHWGTSAQNDRGKEQRSRWMGWSCRAEEGALEKPEDFYCIIYLGKTRRDSCRAWEVERLSWPTLHSWKKRKIHFT